jgi:RNA polymerase sigma-70 factor (ECF subfamily)
MDHVDENSLVCEALGGCQLALGDLYARNAGLVRALCIDATGRLADAEDLTQEVFLRAFRQLETLRDASRFQPWLVGITRLVIKEWRRGQIRDSKARSHAPSPRESRSERVDSADEFTCVLQLMSRLSDEERLALHLFYLQECPVDAARDIMGLSRSGFYRVLDRAKKRLAAQLRSTRGTGCEQLNR